MAKKQWKATTPYEIGVEVKKGTTKLQSKAVDGIYPSNFAKYVSHAVNCIENLHILFIQKIRRSQNDRIQKIVAQERFKK